MNLSKKVVSLGICILLISVISCKKDKRKLPSALNSIDLKRGDLLLCSSEAFGEINFSLSCNYETRETFELGLALLHSFEYAEAEKTFVKVIDQDPECAMAYWGVSMSIFQSLWMQSDLSYLEKGKKLLAIARTLDMDDRERDYLNAISVYYENWDTTDQMTRKRMYENKMEELYIKHKDDTEAAVFYALAIRAAADPSDKEYIRQRKSGEILENLFKENQNHPGIAHYIIHNYDYPELASKALNTARRYAQIAPASAHAQHMPSHIFTRLGLWDESIDTNINSASSAVCYAQSVNPEANWTQEIHANDYLVYAYLQLGDNKSAQEEIDNMKEVKKIFPENHFAASYALIAMPVRMALENKDWEQATNLELPSIEFPWEKLAWEKAMLHFGKALGYAHLKNINAAEAELETLKILHQSLLNSNDNHAKTYKAGQVNIQVKTIEGWIALVKGNKEEALKSMRMAVDLESKTSKHPVTPGEVLPAGELLGDMLLALDLPQEALEAYEVNLLGHPNRFNGIYGAAIAAKKAGNTEKATRYFQQLIDLAKGIDSNRPELMEAKDYVS